jgi:Tfp pilus assembly protein PilX
MNTISLGLYLTILLVIVMTTMHGFTIYPVSAQTTKNSSNMTSAMMASASLHLKLANQAINNGNTKEASNQLNLAQLQ